MQKEEKWNTLKQTFFVMSLTLFPNHESQSKNGDFSSYLFGGSCDENEKLVEFLKCQ